MSQPTLYATISDVVTYVETNARSRLTLDTLAERTYLSKFHLHRLFRRLTGRPLMDYVRSRQLAHSLGDLLDSGLRVSDIAQEYGFEHHQSYIRAFRSEYGVTPAQFRAGSTPVRIADRLDLQECEDTGEGMIVRPEIVVKPAFHVVGMRHRINLTSDCHDLTATKLGQAFYFQHSRRITGAVAPHIYIGLTRVPEAPYDYTYYIPSLEVALPCAVPEGMVLESVAAQKYAVFKYVGLHHYLEISARTLSRIWRYVFQVWMPRTEFGSPERMSFEWIDTSVARDDYCEVDLYFPIDRMSSH